MTISSPKRARSYQLAVLLFWSTSAFAGSFTNVAKCTSTAGCKLDAPVTQHPLCDPDCEVPASAIVHALGFTGTQTTLPIRICVAADSLDLEGPTERAVETWKALTPVSENCDGCVLWEEALPPITFFDAETTVLHELGHCAMALDHVNRLWDADGDGVYERTSFTLSAEAASTPTAVDDGADNIRGSKDDFHTAPVGGQPADSVSWFRRSDNDPFAIDGTVIEMSTYSRSVSNLPTVPAGHTWGASGNRVVGESLGYTNSQAVMYSRTVPELRYLGLSADDVNMVKMAMTGVDRTAGTSDDYTIDLQYLGVCGLPGTYDIMVRLTSLAAGTTGVCDAIKIDYSFDPGNPFFARHFTLVEDPFEVRLNSNLTWRFGGPDLVLAKDDGGVTIDPGDTIVYTVTIENIGDEDATGVVLSEVAPAGTMFNAGSSHASWSCGGTTPGSVCTLAVGAVNKGAAAQAFAFAATVDNPTTVAEVSNTATAADDGASGPDNDPSNNIASDLTPVNVPCAGTVDLLLTIPGVDPVVVHEACNSITAGTTFTILSGRDVAFKARNLIELTDGFAVESGAAFSAELDPLAGQLPPE